MSRFRIDLTFSSFRRDWKKAVKKYPTITNDLKELLTQLESRPTGDPIPGFGRKFWKVRMPVKGLLSTRAGYRLIYHLDGTRQVMTPIFFYSKSEREDVLDKEIQKAARRLLESFGLHT